MRDGLEIDADTLRLLYDLMIEIDRHDQLPAHGAKVLAHLTLQPEGTADQAEVAEALGLSDDQIGRICDKLRAQGLLRRRESTTDRRAYRLTVNEKGRSEIGKLNQAVRSILQKLASRRISP